jgi:hypothetical protein
MCHRIRTEWREGARLIRDDRYQRILWTILVSTRDQLPRNAVVGFSDWLILEIARKAGYPADQKYEGLTSDNESKYLAVDQGLGLATI